MLEREVFQNALAGIDLTMEHQICISKMKHKNNAKTQSPSVEIKIKIRYIKHDTCI